MFVLNRLFIFYDIYIYLEHQNDQNQYIYSSQEVNRHYAHIFRYKLIRLVTRIIIGLHPSFLKKKRYHGAKSKIIKIEIYKIQIINKKKLYTKLHHK